MRSAPPGRGGLLMGFEGYCVDTWQRVRAELASDAVLEG